MRYLLDTCTLSDFVKGDKNTMQKIKESSPLELAVSSITVMEIEYGLLLIPGKKAATIKIIIDDLFQAINIIPFCTKTAEHAAQIRAELHKQGKPIGYYDILIGATAIYHDLVMVTANIEEFKRIKPLTVQNWRECHYA